MLGCYDADEKDYPLAYSYGSNTSTAKNDFFGTPVLKSTGKVTPLGGADRVSCIICDSM